MREIIEALSKQISNLQSKRHKVEAEEFREKKLPRLKEQIGKTFVWRNNTYGGSNLPRNYWDVFRKLVAVELDHGSHYPNLIFQECFIDSDGKATLRLNRVLSNLAFPNEKWGSCLSEEFDKAWATTMAALLTHELDLLIHELDR